MTCPQQKRFFVKSSFQFPKQSLLPLNVTFGQGVKLRLIQVVRGHVSEKSFSWVFYEHFSFFTETYSVNGIESTKRCLQFFESYVCLFYAN